MISINETKLDHTVIECEVEIDEYQIIRNDRNSFGSCVALYIHDSVPFTLYDAICSDLESLTIKLNIPYVRPILITTIYRPPGSTVDLFPKLEELLRSLEPDDTEIIFMGDFNCGLFKTNDNDTKHIKRIYNMFKLRQMINQPTRVTGDTKTLIDHMATNRPDAVSHSGVIACGISDHDLVCLNRSMRLTHIKRDPKVIETRKYNHFDSTAFLTDLKAAPFNEISRFTNSPSEMWTIWKTLYLDILNKHAPVTKIKIKGNNLPYITSKVRRMIRQRDYVHKKANETGSKYLRQAFLNIRDRVYQELRYLRNSYYSGKIDEHKSDPKQTWKILKQTSGRGNKSAVIEQIIFNDQVLNEKQDIAEACNQYFASVGNKLTDQIQPSQDNPIWHIPVGKERFQFKQIKPAKVNTVLGKLKNGKATGIHNIPNKSLKLSKDIIASSLTAIFNACIKERIFINDFKTGKVSPVFKSGRKDLPGNYRPITVLPTIARVFVRIVYEQIYSFLTTNNFLSRRQWGFRSLRSTVLALSDCTNEWLLNIDQGGINAVFFLHIKKAFDTVNHEVLLTKLQGYGIRGQELEFLTSYLSERIQCCNVNGKTSGYREITYGVPQGSILGPLLFILYMNDLPAFIPNAKIRMYADDTNLGQRIDDVNDINQQLIPDFRKLCEWLEINKLSLNFMKTEFLLFGNQSQLRNLMIW